MVKNLLLKMIVVLVAVFAANASAITLTAIWDGGGNGTNWSDPLNWDIDVVPNNQGPVVFDVTIPAGKTVNFDIAGDNEITNFTLGDNGSNDARLNVNEDCNLTIIGSADIFDLIYANGGNFTSTADPDSLDGTRNRLYALNGSIVTINDNEFNSSGQSEDSTILSVDGTNSLLNLPELSSIIDEFSNYYYQVHKIQATNNGKLNLSGLKSIKGPADNEDLQIILDESGGSIDLSSLETIIHTNTYGLTKFIVSGNSLSLPSISSVEFTLFSVSNNGTIEANNSSFTYSTSGLHESYTLLSCDGAGSVLDLSGMTTMNDVFTNYHTRSHTIQALNGGFINLSNLTNIQGPGSDESINFNLNETGGSINLDSLTNISTADTFGFVNFNIKDNSISFPKLSVIESVKFNANNSDISLPSLSKVDDALFYVSNGGKIEANSTSFPYSATNLNNGSYTLLSVDGTDSILDLSGMLSIVDGFSNYYYQVHKIQATNNGKLNLSGLKSIKGPADNEDLQIILDESGGSIDLSSLETIIHTNTYGLTKFIVSGNSLSLPSISSVEFTLFSVSNNGTIEANNSSFTYSTSGLHESYTLLSCDGAGSVLDLSGMTTMNDVFTNYHTRSHTIQALNDGFINLSNLTNIQGPGSDESINFNLNETGGSINLDSLTNISTADTFGFVNFNIKDNSISFPKLSVIESVKFNANNSDISLPSLSKVDDALFYVSNGGKIEANSTSFPYSATNLNNGSYTLLSVDGTDSILDLSGMLSIVDGFSNYYYQVHKIQATNNGKLNLSGLKSIKGPADNEDLQIILDESGGSIDLSSLETIIHTNTYGLTKFIVSGNSLSLPSISSVEFTLFSVSNNGTIEANNSSFTYSTSGLHESYTLLSCDGAGSVLDLSGMTTMNDVFTNYHTRSHTIQALNDGFINLSNLTNIQGPGSDESINFNLNTKGNINLSSLEQITGSTGSVNFTLNENASVVMSSLEYYNVAGTINATLFSEVELGSTAFNGGSYHNISLSEGSFLSAQSVSATQPVAITLNSPNDIIEIAGDFALSNKISITNPEAANISIGGDYTYSSTNEGTQQLASSVIYMSGQSPQKIEIGGINVDIYTQFLTNDNFGLGQLSIGRCSNRSTVFLADDFDNGNLSGTDSEALYLFGIDGQDGLKISEGSSLYLCYLPTYAMINGSMTSLIDLLGSQMSIPFDQGTIYLGCPQPDSETNLVLNHQFTNGQLPPTFPDITIGDWKYSVQPGEGNIFDWTVANGTLNWIYNSTSFNHYIDFSTALVDGLDILPANPPLITNIGTISQTIDTIPGKKYMLWFDMADYGTGNSIMVSAADDSAEFYCEPAAAPEISDGTIPAPQWQSRMWRFTAQGVSTTITFESTKPEADLNVAIDNVYVNFADGYESKPCNMNDLETISSYWLSPCHWNNCNCESSDINEDGLVDLFDFALLADNWLDCGGPRTYSIIVDATEGGSVIEPGIGKFSYLGSQEIDITAQADDHYSFTGWTGTAVEAGKLAEPESLSTTLIIDDNYTLQANFVIDQYTITISSDDNGTVTTPGTGQFSYDYNSVITVSAEADDNYHFVDWTGTAVDNGMVDDPTLASTTVSVSGDYTLQANFVIDQYTITISSDNNGTVTTPGIGQFSYDYNSVITVSAKADDYYHFVEWTGTAVDNGMVDDPTLATTTVTVDGNFALQANFVIDQYTITISSDDNGTVTKPGIGQFSYDYGSVVSVSAEPYDFYHFVEWTGTAVNNGLVNNPYLASTTVSVKGDYTIEAVFAINSFDEFINNDFDQDPTWSATGQWSFGIPTGQGGDLFGYPDPSYGYTGDNVYGVNLDGDYGTIIGGPYYLTAGPFDLTGYYQTELQFASWLNSDIAEYVIHNIQISTDGTNWNDLWVQTGRGDLMANEWSEIYYDISNIADNSSSIYFRWGYQIIRDRAYPYSGWNIDDLKINGRLK